MRNATEKDFLNFDYFIKDFVQPIKTKADKVCLIFLAGCTGSGLGLCVREKNILLRLTLPDLNTWHSFSHFSVLTLHCTPCYRAWCLCHAIFNKTNFFNKTNLIFIV